MLKDFLTVAASTFEKTTIAPNRRVDLGIAWEWEYDQAFIERLQSACASKGLSTCVIAPASVETVTAKYRGGELVFDFYLDRGSDAAKEFLPLAQLVEQSGSRIINRYAAMQWAMDKATMHLEFLAAGLDVPYTIILSPYSKQPKVEIEAFHKLGRPFIIKPAIGGGGVGVVTGAETLSDIVKARMSQNRQKHLLQKKIEPVLLGNKRAWFRAYYVLGDTHLAWWDDLTHVYQCVERAEEREFYLSPLRDLITKIAKISGLDFFSAEIALTPDGRFVVVDYVNEVCDMRSQNAHADGVPERLLHEITSSLTGHVFREKRKARSKEHHAHEAASRNCGHHAFVA
jgi:glutathione synthase/RimK-type ligase-like ATP-grasp enzyme